MKRLASILVISAVALTASAQNEQGKFNIIPRLGVNLFNVSGSDIYLNAETNDKLEGKTKAGVFAGVDVQYQALPTTAFSLGAFYSREGCRFDETDLSGREPGKYSPYSDESMSYDYLQVPIMVHQYIARGLSINAGIQPGFLLHANLHYEQGEVTIGKDGHYEYGNITEKDQKLEDGKTFAFAIPVGISYEYMNVILDARYVFGLTNTYKDDLWGKNHGVTISVGYKL